MNFSLGTGRGWIAVQSSYAWWDIHAELDLGGLRELFMSYWRERHGRSLWRMLTVGYCRRRFHGLRLSWRGRG